MHYHVSHMQLYCVHYTYRIAQRNKNIITIITRRSENDDTPQPLDQWTNIPFMGQQVGNWSICHTLWPKRKPIVHPTLYPTHISFIPSQSIFPFLKYGYKNLTLKIKIKVMGEVKVLSHNLGPTSYQIVLEIPTGPPVRGRQLWRRTGNFLLIFLQYDIYDLRFKPWGPTPFWPSFQHCWSYGFISFYVNPPSYSYDRAFSKFDFQNPRSKS